MVKFSTHFLFKPIICKYCKPRQIQFTSLKPSTTYYTLSSLAFTIFHKCLTQPDIFYFKTKLHSFSLFFFFFNTYYQPTSFPLAFQTILTFHEILKVVFFLQSRIQSHFMYVLTLKYYTLKTAIFLTGSKTVWLDFTW